MTDTDDVTEIVQLIVGERSDRDHRRWGPFRAAYLPDSTVAISWFTGSGPDFVAATRARFEHSDPGMHFVSAVPVRLHGDRAIAPVPLSIQLNPTWHGVPLQLTSVVIGYYSLEKRDGRWGIHGFECSYVRDSIAPVFPGDVVPIDRDLLAGYRPSYRFLSYAVAQGGQEPDHNLPGADRPDLVTAIEDRLERWATRAPAPARPH